MQASDNNCKSLFPLKLRFAAFISLKDRAPLLYFELFTALDWLLLMQQNHECRLTTILMPFFYKIPICGRHFLHCWGSCDTYIDQLNLPDLFDQLHGRVAVDEERLCVVAELQRLQPLGHWRGVVAIVAHRSHLNTNHILGRKTTFLNISKYFIRYF